jgi:hypothetical protein
MKRLLRLFLALAALSLSVNAAHALPMYYTFSGMIVQT